VSQAGAVGALSLGDFTKLAGALGLGALSPRGVGAGSLSPVTGAFPISRA
jgi:hypothetical protein